MRALFSLFAIIIGFSLLTLCELVLLKKADFDVIAHLKITQGSGNKTKFFFEAFGVVAVVLFQPIALTCLLVWTTNNINPEFARRLLDVVTTDSIRNFLHNL